jgi:hypothetical protein
LGECLLWEAFLENYASSQTFSGAFFCAKVYALNLTKIGLSNILGDIFQRLVWSLCRVFHRLHLFDWQMNFCFLNF